MWKKPKIKFHYIPKNIVSIRCIILFNWMCESDDICAALSYILLLGKSDDNGVGQKTGGQAHYNGIYSLDRIARGGRCEKTNTQSISPLTILRYIVAFHAHCIVWLWLRNADRLIMFVKASLLNSASIACVARNAFQTIISTSISMWYMMHFYSGRSRTHIIASAVPTVVTVWTHWIFIP